MMRAFSIAVTNGIHLLKSPILTIGIVVFIEISILEKKNVGRHGH
jgi:hypothetical protein